MNNLVGSEKSYQEFVETMMEIDDQAFPILLEREEPMAITMPEIKEFMDRFKTDTDLDISIHLTTCDDCGRLHMTIVIDLPEDIRYGNLHLVQ